MRWSALGKWLVLAALFGIWFGAARAEPVACRSVYLAGFSWHAGLIVAAQDVAPARSLGTDHFANRQWLEFGWGDAEFYQAEEPTPAMALKAMMWPTETVMHVNAFNGAPADRFPNSEVIELRLPEAGYRRLIGFVQQSFARDAAGKAIPLRPGLYGHSLFFRATGRYHALRTCNTWTAEALEAAGFPIPAAEISLVSDLMDRVRGRTHPACRPAAKLGGRSP